MCRLILVVSEQPVVLSEVVQAKEVHNKNGKRKALFSVGRDEKVHGFGIAWHASAHRTGVLVTLNAPLLDINVRRVCDGVVARVALAHLRCCACDACPATTYCGPHYLNTQPLVYRHARGDVTFAHVGILGHHLALERGDGPAARRARSVEVPDSNNSDTAFLFRIVLSFYDDPVEDDVPRLARAIARAIDVASADDSPPCSLNVAAADAECVVVCRYRSPGDDKPPPPLWWRAGAGGTIVASAPVSLSRDDGNGRERWYALDAGSVVAVSRRRDVTHAWRLEQLDDGDGRLRLVRDAKLATAFAATGAREAASSPTPEPRYIIPPRTTRAPSRAKKEAPPPEDRREEDAAVWTRAADAELRTVVRDVFERHASSKNSKKTLGRAAAEARKHVFGDLKRSLCRVSSRDEGEQQIAAARRRLEAACSAIIYDDACGDGADGDLAREILSRGRGCSRLEALATVQARLYDARFEDAAVGEAGSADKAGVEEVKDVMVSEASAFRAGLRLARSRRDRASVVDFGCGDGRFVQEFTRAAEVELEPGATLFVLAYDVSPGALKACRRRCVRDLGFANDRDGVSKVLADDRRVEIEFAEGDATAPPRAVEDILRRRNDGRDYDVVLSGWGSTSAIPDLVEVDADEDNSNASPSNRQTAFIQAFARLAPVLVQVVSSANNFAGPAKQYADLRAARRAATTRAERRQLDAQIRLAARPGQFYYRVADHDYFYSAVDPTEETRRLGVAGFGSVHVRACNVASFRDILASPKLAKLEKVALALVDANRHQDLERFLLRAVAKATRRP
ncbi:hypothetical protein CTAYLR_005025 [Chrysophaeum taylorii]|uniref:Uncharacterized protein n=1 Tax=Chrysophaeum taylorii TaxID=2483200 RepID=A0AAD7UAM5_9STRA|nr:hypothetical protein CTAYLR_005025 [Chrysophaeum taylorii]